MDDSAMDKILEPFLRRVRVRRGSGLTRGMNHALRSYPQIPVIIRRTALWLGRAERTFNFSGIQVRTMDLYLDLIQAHDDWGADIPVVTRLLPREVRQIADRLGDDLAEEAELIDHPAFAGTVAFKRVRRLPWHQFAAAMTIARRIGLLCGHGRIGLNNPVRQRLKRLAAASGRGDSAS